MLSELRASIEQGGAGYITSRMRRSAHAPAALRREQNTD